MKRKNRLILWTTTLLFLVSCGGTEISANSTYTATQDIVPRGGDCSIHRGDTVTTGKISSSPNGGSGDQIDYIDLIEKDCSLSVTTYLAKRSLSP